MAAAIITFIGCLLALIVASPSLARSQGAADYSRFNLGTGNAVDVLVIDNSGRRTGFDRNSQQRLQEIPQSAYFVDAVHDDLSGEPASAAGHQVQIYQPAEGIYRVTLTGLALGTYSVSFYMFSQLGMPTFMEMEGLAALGSTATFQVSLQTTPGAQSVVTRIATFAVTLADIDTSQQLGFITNKGVANSLSQKLRNAERASEPARSNILKAFKAEVTAQADKHIKGTAVQVLLEDVESLLGQK